MNIGIVTQFTYPCDQEIRARKITSTLCKGDYNVFIICPKERYQKPNEKMTCAIIRRFGYFSNFSWFNHFLSIPLPINPFWIIWIFQVGKQEKLNLLIVRDLRLALPTILAAKLLKLSVVLDFGENFPALAKAIGKHKPSDYIIRNKILISFLESICAKLADCIWVVVEENRQRLIDKGIKESKIRVVSNMPELIQLRTNGNDRLSFQNSYSRFRMIFVGLLTPTRGLALILQSIPYILERENNIELMIVGDGKDRSRLENLTRKLGIENVVKFTGWVKTESVPELINESDVGLIPHALNELTQTTISNKLFDYMMVGLPVLATDMKPVRKIIETEQCGLIIPDDPGQVAEIILRLKASPDLLMKMGDNGRKAVFERYNWQVESKKIFETIEELIAKNYKPLQGE